jgi:polygalacturonase
MWSISLLRSVSLLALLWLANIAYADDMVVRDAGSLRETLRRSKPGVTLKIASGDYPGGYYVEGVDNLTIEALDPKNPPHFKGGSNAWHFSRCNDLTLRNLQITGQSGNGLNLDDGGRFDQPVKGITLERLMISDIGPKGNHDGVKCSGLVNLTIRDCTISGWGGQGIDMVGCHDSLVSGCRFVGKPNFTATAGVQTKGGSYDITIEKCHFIQAGERPMNIGGSTDLRLFRPAGAKYEARRIVVRDNTIEGSSCTAAFVGVDGAEFIGNTILYPEKWIFRVLQETTAEGFNPCRNVLVRDNRIIFRRAQVQIEINIGSGTDPKSFMFEGNQWFAEDYPESSKPRLPNEEKKGVYGMDPRRK